MKPALSMIILFCCACALAEDSKPVILLTGFEPFGKSKFNTSWDIVNRLEGQEIAGHTVKTVKLKVVYDEIDAPLKDAVEKLKPAAVISFGEGTKELHVERVAANGYHWRRPPDNKKQLPPREKIAPDGPANLKSGLPVDTIIEVLNAAHYKALASEDAGGYLCNECFYRLMLLENAPPVRGFVHVPVIRPSDKTSRKELEDAVRLVVRTVIEKKVTAK